MRIYIFALSALVLLLSFINSPLRAHAAPPEIASMRGVSLPSLEWACVQYNQIYDFPLTDTSKLLQKWKVNTVRLPLNQNCWLKEAKYRTGVNKVISHFSGAGFSIILDLHWNQPKGAKSKEQQVMADAVDSVAFWKSVATEHKDTKGVIAFELYNEPHSITWDCWKKGCATKEGWKTASMQSLVDAVRSTGAKQWLIVNGLHWANDVVGASQNVPFDPQNKIALGWHVYDEFNDPNKCVTTACFESKIKPLAQRYPIVITEFGSRLYCNPDHDDRVMKFAAANGIGLIAWGWYPADCGFPALIKDWKGTASSAGSRFCSFLKGTCTQPKAAVVVASTAPVPKTTVPTTPAKAVTPATSATKTTPGVSAAPTATKPATGCTVNLGQGILTMGRTMVCATGYTLTLTGASKENWGSRISSFKTSNVTVSAGYDYFAKATHEHGNEVWQANKAGNVGIKANDRLTSLNISPSANGSVTVYQDGNQKGTSLTFTIKKI
jgi:endoglucanase